MFVVYWTEVQEELKIPKCAEFQSDDMRAALQAMESLRNRPCDDGDIWHITMCSENPNSVGRPGVAETGPDYN